MRADRQDKRWWQHEGDQHETVVAQAAALRSSQESRVDRARLMRTMFSGRAVGADRSYIPASIEWRCYPQDNVCLSAVEAVVAKLTKNLALPNVVTTAGDWGLQRKARKLTRWLEGEFKRCSVHRAVRTAVRDATIEGTGALKIFPRNSRPKVERVRCDRIFLDPLEEEYNDVRTLYQVVPMDRGVLKELYPEHAAAITEAAPADERPGADSVLGDFVDVIEAWHLPSSPDAEDGAHTIVIQGATLVREPWEVDHFPFLFLRWIEDPDSFWGIGIVEQVVGSQSEINRLVGVSSDAARLLVPQMLVDEGSDVGFVELTNEVGRVIKYKGTKPEIWNGSASVFADYSAREDTHKRRAFENVGVSQLSAQAQKPAGLNSGKAQLVFHDIESERFADKATDIEELIVAAAERLIEVMEDLSDDENVDAEVLVGRKNLELLDYRDLSFGDDPYQITVLPVSKLSTRLEGRIAQIDMLMDRGLITDVEQARRLLDMPDLDAASDQENAAFDLLDKLICDAIDGKKNVVVPAYVPLDYAARVVSLQLALASHEGAPSEVEDELSSMLGQISLHQQRLVAATTPPPSTPAIPAAPDAAVAPPAPPAPPVPGPAAVAA